MSATLPPTEAEISTLADDFAAEAKSDYVGLWQICIRVRYDFKAESPEQIKRIVLRVVEMMLAIGMEAVNLVSSGSGRISWRDQNPASVLARISTEWQALGREPSVGDIVWFDKPDTGGRS